jgi:hypothetical protein
LYIGFKVGGTAGVGAYLQFFIGNGGKNIAKVVTRFKDLFAQIAHFTLLAFGAYRSYNFFLKEKRVSLNLGVTLIKLIYLAYRNIRKKGTQPLKNWSQIFSQRSIIFGDRLKLSI